MSFVFDDPLWQTRMDSPPQGGRVRDFSVLQLASSLVHGPTWCGFSESWLFRILAPTFQLVTFIASHAAL
jgi:hypothetical protein